MKQLKNLQLQEITGWWKPVPKTALAVVVLCTLTGVLQGGPSSEAPGGDAEGEVPRVDLGSLVRLTFEHNLRVTAARYDVDARTA